MSLSSTKPDNATVNNKGDVFEIEPFAELDTFQDSGEHTDTFEVSHGVNDYDEFRLVSMNSATEEAIGIVEEAKRKATVIESEAYQKGFAQGEKDGFELGNKKADKLLERMQGILQDMAAYKTEIIRKYEEGILNLISAIAEKVVRGSVVVGDNPVIRKTIFEAFRVAVDRSEVTVRVNPDQVEYVKEIRPEFFGRISELKSIKIEADPSIEHGGCFMETVLGNVDARLETQLEKIAEAVQKAYEEESSSVVQAKPKSEELDPGTVNPESNIVSEDDK